MEEKELVEGISKRNVKMLNQLIDDYSSLLYGVMSSILTSSHERDYMDECYNDVLLAVWYKIAEYDETKGSFKSWLITITKYKAIDYKRKYYKRYEEKNIEDVFVSIEENMDEKLISEEDRELLREAINQLDEIDKQIFNLRYIEQYSIEKVANQLKMSESAIYTRISRGKPKLKKWMEGNFYELYE